VRKKLSFKQCTTSEGQNNRQEVVLFSVVLINNFGQRDVFKTTRSDLPKICRGAAVVYIITMNVSTYCNKVAFL